MPRTLTDQERVARIALERARKRWGAGWELLSREQREGAVALEVAYILLSWEQTPADAVHALYRDAFALLPD